jgi:hypothetical protein
MIFDGLIADIEKFGNLFVTVALRNVCQDFCLAAGEWTRFESVWTFVGPRGHFAEGLEDSPGQPGLGEHVVVDQIFALAHPTNGFYQFVRRDIARCVGCRPHFDGLEKPLSSTATSGSPVWASSNASLALVG